MEGTRQKTRDYHGSDWTDYGRSELVMGLVVMPPAELFAHIQAASMNVCAAYRNCTAWGTLYAYMGCVPDLWS